MLTVELLIVFVSFSDRFQKRPTHFELLEKE